MDAIMQELLDGGPCCPKTGRPMPEPDRINEMPLAMAAKDKRHIERLKKWAALPSEVRSQLVVNLRFGSEPASVPRWRIFLSDDFKNNLSANDDREYGAAKTAVLKAKGHTRPKKTCYPTLVIPATDELHATGRYQEICGIASIGEGCKYVIDRVT